MGKKDVAKVEYNDPHKHASKLHGFPFSRRLTQSAIYGIQIFDSDNTVGHLWESNFWL